MAVVAIAVTICVTASFRISSVAFPNVPDYLSLLASTIVGGLAFLISRSIASWFIEFRAVRRFFLGKKYVEGHWLIITRPPEDLSLVPLLQPGVLFLSFQTHLAEFVVRTTRLTEDGEEFITPSEVVNVRTAGQSTKYLNFFEFRNPNGPKLYGYASGLFSDQSSKNKFHSQLEAETWLQTEQQVLKQYARRIPDKVVDKYHLRHGDNWVRAFLLDCQDFEALRKISLSSDSI